MSHEILILLPSASVDASWPDWLASLRASEGFVGAREVRGCWYLLVAPASRAAAVARDFFNDRNTKHLQRTQEHDTSTERESAKASSE